MGEWLATVRFGNGDVRYARYSTVVESVLSDLYPAANRDGPRALPAGEPDPGRPGDPPAPVDALLPVVITVEPDGATWHAVYDPARDVVAGPYSSMHCSRLQDEYYLRPEPSSGVRHLTTGTAAGLCGRAAGGDELPFHRPHWLVDAGPEPPEIDLFADWAAGTVCRDCLLATL